MRKTFAKDETQLELRSKNYQTLFSFLFVFEESKKKNDKQTENIFPHD